MRTNYTILYNRQANYTIQCNRQKKVPVNARKNRVAEQKIFRMNPQEPFPHKKRCTLREYPIKKPRKRPGKRRESHCGKITAGKCERTPDRHFCQILKIMSGGLAKIPELCYNTVATRLNTRSWKILFGSAISFVLHKFFHGGKSVSQLCGEDILRMSSFARETALFLLQTFRKLTEAKS